MTRMTTTTPPSSGAAEAKTYEYLSYSSFSTLTGCGEKYRLTRLVGVPEDPAVYFIGGTAFHHGCDVIDHALFEFEQEVTP